MADVGLQNRALLRPQRPSLIDRAVQFMALTRQSAERCLILCIVVCFGIACMITYLGRCHEAVPNELSQIMLGLLGIMYNLSKPANAPAAMPPGVQSQKERLDQ